MDFSLHHQRRIRLLEQMRARGGGVAVIPTAPELTRNADNTFPFRHDSNFFYLTGFPEPEAVLVLVAAESDRTILFCREKHAERELWEGFRHGPTAAAALFGIEEAESIGDLEARLPGLLSNQATLFYSEGSHPAIDRIVAAGLTQVRAQARSGVTAPVAVFDVRALLAEMRLFKAPAEILTMRAAAEISAGAHLCAMRATRPGKKEYEIEAELLAEFRRRGAQSPAYGSIVAGGANACVLHYSENNQTLRDGDLLLIDAGCELDGYASDITRTFPVGGVFSGVQKALYELVLAAQDAALAKTAPGARWNEPHDAATRVLAQGMVDLGLLDGSVDGVLESGAYRAFYMHRTGHWLGMDVHDVGDYREPLDPTHPTAERPWRVLAPGMVLTVEPGLYVRASERVPERFWNQGIRVEDDVVVTDGGCEILSGSVPKSIAEIESIMRP